MGKMNELSQIIDDMVKAGNDLVGAASALREYFSSDGPPCGQTEEERSSVPSDDAKPLTKEDVRKLLVEKSNIDDGAYKPQVKALVRKYSESGSLSNVKPEHYEALLAELEVIGNA